MATFGEATYRVRKPGLLSPVESSLHVIEHDRKRGNATQRIDGAEPGLGPGRRDVLRVCFLFTHGTLSATAWYFPNPGSA